MNEQQHDISTRMMIFLMAAAYIFSFMIRMIWVYQFKDDPSMYWDGQLMINTNDGYAWATAADHILNGTHQYNPRLTGLWESATVFLTVLLVKITPMSLETVILYMPAIISSLVVIPVILIARLYGKTVWGVLAAMLAAITWSYYNRTMTGYYDTDMFSAMVPMFILYFLMKSTIDFTPRTALYAAIAIAVYPFFYNSGKSIIYAMGIIYALYMVVYHRHERTTYLSMVMVFAALVPFHFDAPWNYIVKIVMLVGLYAVLIRSKIEQQKLMIISLVLFVTFMYVGNVFDLILNKVSRYLESGTAHEGLHFYSVSQTIREAGSIPFEVFANRISGSIVGFMIAVIGYVLLVIKHRAFLLALPLMGIGGFAWWGGLRFTVYAVPVAAMSAIYLFHIFMHAVSKQNRIYIAGMVLLTIAMLYPNIKHIVGYRVPTVLTKAEVQDLDKLQKIADAKDYTLTWWDYGYPIWFYSDTNTIIDGGKHQNDNFIISKIMQTSSPQLAANLSRLAVETYVDSNYSVITDTLFKNKTEEQVDPNIMLSELEDPTYKLPPKTREVYLYMPHRMLNIFPTVMTFANLDLSTGKKERHIAFWPTQVQGQKNALLQFTNGIVFDTQKGIVRLGKQTERVKLFAVTQLTKEGEVKVKVQPYYADGDYVVIYMQSYRQFIIMDSETFKSIYVQMFMLGKYDKSLFEPVVVSPYTRIYRLKK